MFLPRSWLIALGRAFGFVISKLRTFKTLDYYIFNKLFDTCLTPIIDYGAGVWGFKDYNSINVVQNKILRYFLGVHKFAPNLGLWPLSSRPRHIPRNFVISVSFVVF